MILNLITHFGIPQTVERFSKYVVRSGIAKTCYLVKEPMRATPKISITSMFQQQVRECEIH